MNPTVIEINNLSKQFKNTLAVKNINLKIEKEINNFKRQALHAKSLGFVHPGTKKEVFLRFIFPVLID